MAEAVAVASAIAGGVAAIANVVSAAADAKTAFVDPYISNCTSSNDVKEVRDKLDKSIGRLHAKMKDYKKEVEQDEIKEQSEIFKQWIKDVLELEDQVNKLIGKYDKESEKSSSNYSKEMKKKLEEVNKLLEFGNQIKDQLMVDRQLKSVVKKKAPCIEKIQMFQDRLMDVLESLRNDKISWIGISGMIGVGKTTIMLNLNNHNEVAESFDLVIWVDVSKADSEKNLDTKDLQCEILKRLNKESIEDAHTNASRISRTLMDKKYLLLLDDVKEYLNLDVIGIPDGKKGSKVVLTTRHNEVCYLLVNKVVNVTTLSEKDALEMFQGILQDPKFHKDREKYYLAKQVLRDCHYIPLLIEQLAKTIKQKIKAKNSSSIWGSGRNLLLFHEQASKERIEEYYNLLKGFYYRQMDDVQKRCFLFGALYPEGSDIYIDHLMECLAAVHFHGNDYEKVTLDVCNTLGHLMDLSLLEESKEDCVTMQKTVTMRRFIRKMALYCALSEDQKCNYLVKTNEALEESPKAESWRNKHHVSLSQNKFDQLLPIPDCSDLSTLLLQENLNLKEIPASFFQYTRNLKILDMCQTGIESLPSSISDLINLKVLYLRDCQSLKQLNFAIRLPLLEVLDIRGSKIHNILTHTKNVRRLWISFEKYRVENGTEVRLSQLSELEELVIHMESFDQWNNKVLIKDIIKEVASLKKLRTLQFCFPDKEKVVNVIKDKPMLEVRVPHVEILQIFIVQSCLWRKFSQFSHENPFLLFIGCQISENPYIPETLGYGKYIKYCDGEGTNPPIPEVLANVEAFELVNHKDIVQLSDFVRVDRALSNLQHLYLKDLPKLRNIWSEPGECGSLVKLQTLVLSGCPMLTTIFPANIIQLLHNMESLTVEDCSGAVEIFEKFENGGNGTNQLPSLNEMVLKLLPKLKNIWGDESSKCQSLKKLTLFKCPGIGGESVQINAPNLESFVQQ